MGAHHFLLSDAQLLARSLPLLHRHDRGCVHCDFYLSDSGVYRLPVWTPGEPGDGRTAIHCRFCRPAPVSRYPAAVVAGSARISSTNADPALSGVHTSPSCLTNSSSVWPLRAAYARTPLLPTSANGLIRGMTAVTVMSSPARRASSWA